MVAHQEFPTLSFDFRGYGRSGRRKEIDFFVEHGEDCVVLIGVSIGGTAAMIVGARRSEVVAIGSLSASHMFGGLDAREAVKNLTIPALFAAADGDGSAGEPARGFMTAVQAGNSEVSIVIIPGRDHGIDLLEGENQFDSRLQLMRLVGSVGRAESAIGGLAPVGSE